MNVMRYFFRNSLVRLAAFTIGAASAFMVTPHMLACLGKADYGIWALTSSLASYLLLLDFGVQQSVATLAAAAGGSLDPKERLNDIFSNACCLCAAGMLSASLAAAGLYLGAGAFIDTKSGQDAAALCMGLVAAAVAVQLIFRPSCGVLASQMRWTLLAVITMCRTILMSAAILLWLGVNVSFEENLRRAAIITASGIMLESLVQCVAALFLSRARFKQSRVSFRGMRELLRFGAPLLIMSGGNILRTRVQILLVASTLSLTQTTMFSIARQFINYMDDVMVNVFGIMSPYFSKMNADGNAKESREALLSSLRLSCSVSSYIGLCLAFYSESFIQRWLGEGFSHIQGLLLPLALGSALGLGQYPSSGFLIGVGRHSVLAWVNVAEGLTNIVACVPASLAFGLPGVGWVFFATTVIFRLGFLPPKICAEAGVPLARYHFTTGGILLCQCAAQGAFFMLARPWLAPDYATLVFLCAGQFVVSAAVMAAGTIPLDRLAALTGIYAPKKSPVPEAKRSNP